MISGGTSSKDESDSSKKELSNNNLKNNQYGSIQSNSEEANDFWRKSIDVLKQKLDPQIFAAWIKPLSVGRLEVSEKRALKGSKRALELFAPNKFCCEHVKNHYEKVISSAIGDTLGEGPITLKFKVGNIYIEKPIATDSIDAVQRLARGGATKEPASKENSANDVVAKVKSRADAVAKKSAGKQLETKRKKSYQRGGADQTNLNPKSNFSNYVVGACNQFAHAVSLRVSENLGGHYNPLFIYGGVGLGKTHLANAIGNAAHRRGAKVLLV